MAERYRIQDFTLESIYDTIIRDTGTEEAVKVKIGDSTAYVKENALKAVQSVGETTVWVAEATRDVTEAGIDALEWVVLTPAKAVRDGINIAEDTIVDIVNYISPTSASLNSFEEMGKQMDELIKDSLFYQLFGITYTDVLCSAFCLVVSLLSCKQRTQLYEDIISFQRSLIALDVAADAVASISNQLNVGISSIETIVEAAEGIIGGNPADIFEEQSTGSSAPRAVAGVDATIRNIENIINTINKALDIVGAGRILENFVDYSGIWNLARNILFEMQATAMNWAEEALEKIIKPVEDLIKDIQPSNCLNNKGGAVFNKILSCIRGYKNWLVTQIGMLFTEFYSFNKLMKDFNRGSRSQLELALFTQALKTLAHRFGDLAIVCGVEPCYEDQDYVPQAKKGRPINTGEDDGISSIISFEEVPTEVDGNIEVIADKLKDSLQVPFEDAFVTNDKIVTIYNALQGAPEKLLGMAEEINLGSNYDIAISRETGSVKIVNTIKRYCGEK